MRSSLVLKRRTPLCLPTLNCYNLFSRAVVGGMHGIVVPVISPFVAPLTAQRRTASTVNDDGYTTDDIALETFEFSANLEDESSLLDLRTAADKFLRTILPRFADEKVRAKALKFIMEKPCDKMINKERCIVTHVENEKGLEVKSGPELKGEMPIEKALETARKMNLNLMQMGSNNAVGYCRIVDYRKRVLLHVKQELTALADMLALDFSFDQFLGVESDHRSKLAPNEDAHGKKDSATKPEVDHKNTISDVKVTKKLKDTIVHSFRDIVDEHFIAWRSRKIVIDLFNGHPVKLSIQKFGDPAQAVGKMQEMLAAIKRVSKKFIYDPDMPLPPPGRPFEVCAAESKIPPVTVVHFFNGISVSPTELSVVLQPVIEKGSSKIKETRHPSDSEWEKAIARFNAVTEGKGTYRKNTALKARATDAREFRVDRFGRKIEPKHAEKQ